jgi:hypothetical protein
MDFKGRKEKLDPNQRQTGLDPKSSYKEFGNQIKSSIPFMVITLFLSTPRDFSLTKHKRGLRV